MTHGDRRFPCACITAARVRLEGSLAYVGHGTGSCAGRGQMNACFGSPGTRSAAKSAHLWARDLGTSPRHHTALLAVAIGRRGLGHRHPTALSAAAIRRRGFSHRPATVPIWLYRGLRSDAGHLATVTIRLYRCDSLTAKPGPDEGPGRVSRRIHKDRILTTRRRCRCNSYPGGEPVMQLPQYAA